MIRYKIMRGRGENEGKTAIFRIEEDGKETFVEAHGAEWYARQKAAQYQWAVHLDTWMSSVVEDEDIVEDVMEILGIMAEINFESEDHDAVSKEYDKGVVRALQQLPPGLRLLADRYEKEWRHTRKTA